MRVERFSTRLGRWMLLCTTESHVEANQVMVDWLDKHPNTKNPLRVVEGDPELDNFQPMAVLRMVQDFKQCFNAALALGEEPCPEVVRGAKLALCMVESQIRHMAEHRYDETGS